MVVLGSFKIIHSLDGKAGAGLYNTQGSINQQKWYNMPLKSKVRYLLALKAPGKILSFVKRTAEKDLKKVIDIKDQKGNTLYSHLLFARVQACLDLEQSTASQYSKRDFINRVTQIRKIDSTLAKIEELNISTKKQDTATETFAQWLNEHDSYDLAIHGITPSTLQEHLCEGISPDIFVPVGASQSKILANALLIDHLGNHNNSYEDLVDFTEKLNTLIKLKFDLNTCFSPPLLQELLRRGNIEKAFIAVNMGAREYKGTANKLKEVFKSNQAPLPIAESLAKPSLDSHLKSYLQCNGSLQKEEKVLSQETLISIINMVVSGQTNKPDSQITLTSKTKLLDASLELTSKLSAVQNGDYISTFESLSLNTLPTLYKKLKEFDIKLDSEIGPLGWSPVLYTILSGTNNRNVIQEIFSTCEQEGINIKQLLNKEDKMGYKALDLIALSNCPPDVIELLEEITGEGIAITKDNIDLDNHEIMRNLNTIPKEIGLLHKLRELSYRGGEVSVIPRELCNLKYLEKLDLSKNKITTIPKELSNLKRLRKLDLSKNKIKVLPGELGDLISLKSLRVSCNPVEALPEELGNLGYLEELDLSETQVETFPRGLFNLKNLRSLNFLGCKIKTLPKELGNLTSLEELWSSWNQIKELPEELGNLINLEKLYLENNLIEELPESLDRLTKLRILSLSNNALTKLPEESPLYNQLEQLFCNNNKLEEIPEGLKDANQLSRLRLSNNKIKKVPEFLGSLSMLGVLDLSWNKIQKLPDELADSSLHRLYLQGNEIKHFSFSKQFARLLELNLSWNKVLDLPSVSSISAISPDRRDIFKLYTQGNLMKFLLGPLIGHPARQALADRN